MMTAMNNNVVLAEDANGEQVVLMAKGIGFGRKTGDMVSDEAKDHQIFKLWTDGQLLTTPLQNDRSAVKRAVTDIVKLARERLDVKNPNLYDALLDHIQFAVDRLQFGLPIENPFVQETAFLYPREFKVAGEAVQIIKSYLQVSIGEAETGFIALHLHSACAGGGMDRSMRSVQLYRDIMAQLVSAGAGGESDRRVFLQWVFELIEMMRRKVTLHFPFPQKEMETLKKSLELAGHIRTLVESSCHIALNDDAMCFLTLELEKLRQTSDESE